MSKFKNFFSKLLGRSNKQPTDSHPLDELGDKECWMLFENSDEGVCVSYHFTEETMRQFVDIFLLVNSGNLYQESLETIVRDLTNDGESEYAKEFSDMVFRRGLLMLKQQKDTPLISPLDVFSETRQ